MYRQNIIIPNGVKVYVTCNTASFSSFHFINVEEIYIRQEPRTSYRQDTWGIPGDDLNKLNFMILWALRYEEEVFYHQGECIIYTGK